MASSAWGAARLEGNRKLVLGHLHVRRCMQKRPLRRGASATARGSKDAASPRCEPVAGELRSLRHRQPSVALAGERQPALRTWYGFAAKRGSRRARDHHKRLRRVARVRPDRWCRRSLRSRLNHRQPPRTPLACKRDRFGCAGKASTPTAKPRCGGTKPRAPTKPQSRPLLPPPSCCEQPAQAQHRDRAGRGDVRRREGDVLQVQRGGRAGAPGEGNQRTRGAADG